MAEIKLLPINIEDVSFPSQEQARQILDGWRDQLQTQNPEAFQALVEFEEADKNLHASQDFKLFGLVGEEIHTAIKKVAQLKVPNILVVDCRLKLEENPSKEAALIVKGESVYHRHSELSIAELYILAVAHGVDPNQPLYLTI